VCVHILLCTPIGVGGPKKIFEKRLNRWGPEGMG
jgi:hypothetical protein